MLDTTEELFDAHVAVKLKAPFFIVQGTIRRHIKGRGVPGSTANIITMSAPGGQTYLAPCVASKAGTTGVGSSRGRAGRHRKPRGAPSSVLINTWC